ncbi:MAG: hypothetical protein ACOYI7_08795 [Candidatus Excrementavichristensenella sp.]|jgi:hypothetical protein|nr:hypothetical protein [Bacillota bacterium]NLL54621.1 hypothetical protein [Clostridiales bacterium]
MSGKCYTNADSKYACCPFYKGEDRLSIRCEGLQRGSTLVNLFPSEGRKLRFVTGYCRSVKRCEACAIHAMMQRLYAGPNPPTPILH